VVAVEDLRQVRHVVFARAAIEVVDEVVERRDRTAMVERTASIGNDHDEDAGRGEHAPPFDERAERVGEMFEGVRGEDEVVFAVADIGERRRLRDVLTARRMFGIVREMLARVRGASPYRVCAEVAVVDRAGIGVDRKRAVAREEVARAADLETAPADEKRASDAIRRQPAPEYA